jgi:hypothetical protein
MAEGYEPRPSVDVYSTSEIKVGTWIDGKPLYERTYSVNSSGQAGVWERFDLGIANLSFAFYTLVVGIRSDGACPQPYNVNSGDLLVPSISLSNVRMSIYWQHSSAVYTKFYFTIRYTKTTD